MNTRDIFRAGAPPLLLTAPLQDGVGEMNAARAHDQSADTLRPPQLMGRQRNQIRARTELVKRQTACGLNAIDMQKPARCMHKLRNGRNILQNTGLAIGGLNGDQGKQRLGAARLKLRILGVFIQAPVGQHR